jgi:GT2 family glycosyltransferase
MDSQPSGSIQLHPHVSIITVNTNEKHRLEVYLPSVWAAAGNFEVIISDNGSSDGSIELIEAHYPQTRIVENGKNLGFAAANNRAAASARADFLVFLNPDTTVDANWLSELLEPFHDPSVGLTTPKILLMSNPALLNTCGNDVHIGGLTLCRGMSQPRDCFPHNEDVAAISGAAFAIRREIFEALGGFNEGFFIYMEETALALEAQLRGWRCVYAARSLVCHDYALRFGPRKTLFQERNRYMMLLQLFRWPTLAVLLPTLLATECITWGFVVLQDRRNWPNKFKAYREVFSRRNEILAKRRLNQSQRTVPDRTILKRMGYALDFGQVSRGPYARLAAAISLPLFWVLRRTTLAIVRW